MFSLRTHNIMDYIVGVVLIVSPFLFGFANVSAAANLFMIGGISLIVYSLMTNYHYSIIRVVPLGLHMTMDVILGVLVILGPALFGYRDQITNGQYAWHVIMGIGAVGLVSLTRTRTEAAKSPRERVEIARDSMVTR